MWILLVLPTWIEGRGERLSTKIWSFAVFFVKPFPYLFLLHLYFYENIKLKRVKLPKLNVIDVIISIRIEDVGCWIYFSVNKTKYWTGEYWKGGLGLMSHSDCTGLFILSYFHSFLLQSVVFLEIWINTSIFRHGASCTAPLHAV